jgi:putative membrane protein insertion efficiency factor
MSARRAARALIRVYQLTLSGLLGRQCRYLPTCSAYADEAIARHGAWAGSWMGAARICRCHPLGGSGFDPPPGTPPPGAVWWRPWSYGAWRTPKNAEGRGCNSPFMPH